MDSPPALTSVSVLGHIHITPLVYLCHKPVTSGGAGSHRVSPLNLRGTRVSWDAPLTVAATSLRVCEAPIQQESCAEGCAWETVTHFPDSGEKSMPETSPGLREISSTSLISLCCFNFFLRGSHADLELLVLLAYHGTSFFSPFQCGSWRCSMVCVPCMVSQLDIAGLEAEMPADNHSA